MEALKPFGLTIAHLSILGLILAKGLSQKHLQDLLGIDKSVMVHLIDDLEKRGLAERHSLPDDRRTNIVFLTPSGAEAVAVLGAAAKRVEDDFLSPLTKEQRDLLNQLLQTVTAQSGGDL
jgi:DNA-binding MarR family transcriptional regulator